MESDVFAIFRAFVLPFHGLSSFFSWFRFFLFMAFVLPFHGFSSVFSWLLFCLSMSLVLFLSPMKEQQSVCPMLAIICMKLAICPYFYILLHLKRGLIRIKMMLSL